MTQTSNVDRLKIGYQMWSDKNPEAVAYFLDLVADDVQWRSLADGAEGVPFTECQHGKSGVECYLAGLIGDWDLDHYTVQEFIAQGERVVVLADCAFINKNTGKRIETPKADVWRFREGRAIDFHEFYNTATFLAGTQPD